MHEITGIGLQRRSLSEDVADVLRREIYLGLWKPGQRIARDEIASRLQVSRLPVREALIALEAEGLLLTEPHRGTFVARISQEDVVDQYRVLKIVQRLALSEALENVKGRLVLQRFCDSASETATDAEVGGLIPELGLEMCRVAASPRLGFILDFLRRIVPLDVEAGLPLASPSRQDMIDRLRDGVTAGKLDIVLEIFDSYYESICVAVLRRLEDVDFWVPE
jgi:DNA-binding transcriptional regulator YhcF (GntR family)